MMTAKSLRRNVVAGAMLAVFALSQMPGASADETTVYRDIRKPNGQQRSMAEKQADFAACGHPVSVDNHDFPKFRACMRTHGWVIDHVIPDPSAGFVQNSYQRRGIGNYIYDDVRRPHGSPRGNDEEHADAYVCDRGNNDNIGTPPFDACMRSHGWRLSKFIPTPPSPDDGSDGGVPDWAWTCPFANC
jgi:hypothetical protein